MYLSHNITSDDILNSELDIDEVEFILKSMSNGKAPGPDGVVIEMIKSSFPIIGNHITQLYSSILNSGIFPDEWCNAIIFPLYKKIL